MARASWPSASRRPSGLFDGFFQLLVRWLHQRVQRGLRVLEDHADPVAPDAGASASSSLSRAVSSPWNRISIRRRRGPVLLQKVDHGVADGRFAGAGFADQAEQPRRGSTVRSDTSRARRSTVPRRVGNSTVEAGYLQERRSSFSVARSGAYRDVGSSGQRPGGVPDPPPGRAHGDAGTNKDVVDALNVNACTWTRPRRPPGSVFSPGVSVRR